MPSWFSDHFPSLRFPGHRSRRSPAGSTSLPRTDSAPALPSPSRPSSVSTFSMPSWFSDHFPSLRSRRSRRSPASSTSLPRTESAPALPSASRPSSRLGIPREDTNTTATGASHGHLSFPGNSIDHQINSTDRHVGDRASEHFSAQPSQVSRPVTPSGLVPPNAIRTPEQHSYGVEQPTFPASSSNHTYSVQAQQLLAPLSPPLAATPSQQSLNSDPLIYPSQPQHWSSGMFKDAHDFSVKGGTFQNIKGNVTNNNPSPSQFMKDLLEGTIPGAASDARDYPPRCHPGTRLAILDRCLYFIHNCDGMRKTRWVIGAAGVGKSAIMQSVIESPKLVVSCHASVFLSINGRGDGTKAIATISYQLAAKSKPYRELIEREIIDDPSLLRSSMAKQFLKLIVEPFIHNPQLNSADRILVVIDGLDECNNPRTQLELLRLISDLCIEQPSSPFVWLIASRPEQHITSFFSQSDVAAAHEKEEIVVDSDEACADVERFLRAKLTEIKRKALDLVDPRWPEEQDLWKLANAAGGLFAYADTALRYIGDTTVGSPASQLSDVLNVIDNHPLTDVPAVPQEDHPMASLDALYARILSNVPSKVMMNTRKLLLALAFDWFIDGPDNFVLLCNWLGMTPDDAYAALNHLRSVLRVPRRDEANKENLELFHKSFMDYISDFRRSRFSHDIEDEAKQLMAQCTTRILNEAPDGIDFGDVDYGFSLGTLRRGPGTGAKISLTWPVDEDVDTTGNATRWQMYQRAVLQSAFRMFRHGETTSIHTLSTRFEKYSRGFNYDLFRDLVFVESRRQEFMMRGILKQIPLKAVGIVVWPSHEFIKLQFRRPATTARNLSDPWNPLCKHEREGKWGEGDDQKWETIFFPNAQSSRHCNICMARLQRQLKNRKIRSQNHVVPIWFTSTGLCSVEVRFVDPKDGISEWTYRFWVELSLEERKKYGSDV